MIHDQHLTTEDQCLLYAITIPASRAVRTSALRWDRPIKT